MRLKEAKFSAGLLNCRTRAQLADDGHEVVGPIVDLVARVDVEGNPNVRLWRREAEISRHHADDFALHALEVDPVTHNAWVAAELFLPQRVAQDNEAILAGEIFTGAKRAANLCRRA